MNTLEIPQSNLDAAARVKELEEAMDKLARLGNGDCYGSSDGNRIAQQALGVLNGHNHQPLEPSPSTVSNQTACAQLVDPANSIAESVPVTPPEASKVPDSEFILLRDNRNPLQEVNDKLRKQLATVTKDRDELNETLELRTNEFHACINTAKQTEARLKAELSALKPAPEWVPFDIDRWEKGERNVRWQAVDGNPTRVLVFPERTSDGWRVCAFDDDTVRWYDDFGGYVESEDGDINPAWNLLMLAEPKQGKVLHLRIATIARNGFFDTSYAFENPDDVPKWEDASQLVSVTLPPEDTKP